MKKIFTTIKFCAFLCFWLICHIANMQAEDAIPKDDKNETTSRQVGSFDNPFVWDGRSSLPLSFNSDATMNVANAAEASLSSEACAEAAGPGFRLAAAEVSGGATCASSVLLCDPNVSFSAGVDTGNAEAGPDYGCLGSQPNLSLIHI